MLRFLLCLSLCWVPSMVVQGASVVKASTIQIQKDDTYSFKLKNGMNVVFRRLAGSPIVQLSLGFYYGRAQTAPHLRGAVHTVFSAAMLGGGGMTKEQWYGFLQKYSASAGCSHGIEVSNCHLKVVKDYWPEVLAAFAKVVAAPSFNKKDVELLKSHTFAALKQKQFNPSFMSNETVNTKFYPKGHPYFVSLADSIDQIRKASAEDLKKAFHQARLRDDGVLTVVGDFALKSLKKDLDKSFGGWKLKKAPPYKAATPEFDKNSNFAFKSQPIPTAYITIKSNAPGQKAKDNDATLLMYRILSHELAEEIRTKRSLSYAVHASMINYSLGVGVITASTSKPKETLQAIAEVVAKMKSKTFSHKEISSFRNVFATSYFLILEEHSRLSGALSRAFAYHRDPNWLYDWPTRMDKVSGAAIKEAARKYLRDFRVGVVFDEKKFDKKWVEPLLQSSH